MIINEKNRFVFVHIPKCAGTTVRVSLERFDSTNGRFSYANGFISGFGKIDMGHITLGRLRELFPEEYKKVKEYYSFAVVRDPFKRFPSSLYQHIQMYSGKSVKSMRRNDFVAALDGVIRYLGKGYNYLDYEYIHFQRQRDYIYDDSEMLLSCLYTTSLLNGMFENLSRRTGEPIIQHKQAGEGLIYKNKVSGLIVKALSKLYVPVIKDVIPNNIERNVKLLLMDKPARAYENIFNSDGVKDFIKEYYEEDIQIYRQVEQGLVIADG